MDAGGSYAGAAPSPVLPNKDKRRSEGVSVGPSTRRGRGGSGGGSARTAVSKASKGLAAGGRQAGAAPSTVPREEEEMAEVAPAQSGSFNDFGMEGLADLRALRDLRGVLKDGDRNEMIAFAQFEHHLAEQATEDAINELVQELSNCDKSDERMKQRQNRLLILLKKRTCRFKDLKKSRLHNL